MKHLTRSTAVLALIASLTACSSSGGASQPSTSPTSTSPAIRLSAPPTSDRKDLTVVIDTTGIPAGTTGNLFAYGGTWNEPPATCAGDRPIATFQITKPGPMPVNVTVPRPGIYSWVLAAPGFTTPCNDPTMRTIIRATTRLDFGVGELGFTQVRSVAHGEGFRVQRGRLRRQRRPERTRTLAGHHQLARPVHRRPRSHRRRMRARPRRSPTRSRCKSAKTAHQSPVTTTPTATGVYRVMATTPETNKVQAATTPCDAESNFVTVVK